MASNKVDVQITNADLPPGYDLAKMMFYAEKHHRPWGHFKCMDRGTGFVAKAMLINGGQRLSRQSHAKRAETWTCAMGVVTAAVGGKKFELRPGDTIHVPVDTPHRIINRDTEPAVVIEVQIGECDEADIVRFEDDYGRATPAADGAVIVPLSEGKP